MITNGTTGLRDKFQANTSIDKSILQAIKEQNGLGEHTMEKGFMSKHWHIAQEKWECISTTKKQYSKQWNVEVVTLLQDYAYKLWKKRN